MFGNLPYNDGMATVTIRELGRQVSGVVNEVRTTGRPTFVTHRGTPVAVLLPLDAEQLEDHVLANAPEYVASMRAADNAIERGDLDAPVLGDDGRLVVRFTTQVVRDATPDEETFAAMTARFTPREIMHLLLVIGQYMMVGRIMATTQLDLEPALAGELLESVSEAKARRASRGDPE